MLIQSELTWDQYYMFIALAAALRSKDPSTKVGAVVVKDHITATGYNGFPIGIKDLYERWERPHKYKFVVHAEANALTRARFDTTGGTIYLTHGLPCDECTKLIVQHGIVRVVGGNLEVSSKEYLDKSAEMLEEAGIKFETMDLTSVYNIAADAIEGNHGHNIARLNDQI